MTRNGLPSISKMPKDFFEIFHLPNFLVSNILYLNSIRTFIGRLIDIISFIKIFELMLTQGRFGGRSGGAPEQHRKSIRKIIFQKEFIGRGYVHNSHKIITYLLTYKFITSLSYFSNSLFFHFAWIMRSKIYLFQIINIFHHYLIHFYIHVIFIIILYSFEIMAPEIGRPARTIFERHCFL